MKKYSKRILSLLLVLVLAFSLAVPSVAVGFSDTASHWASREIDTWSDTDVLSGYPDGSFQPEGYITRAELFKIADTLMGYTQAAANTFTDLPGDAWYTEYILRLAAAGVVQGADGQVRPNDNITRQETFAVFARLFGIGGNSAFLDGFRDGAETAGWAKDAAGGLAARGFIQGADGYLRPNDNIKRCEVVKIIDNMIAGYYTRPGTYAPTGNGIVIVKANVSLDKSRFTGSVVIVSGSVTDVTPEVEPEKETEEIVGESFDTLRARARALINAANLPDAAAFAAAGKTICIPGQEILEPQQYENPIFGQVGKDAVIDENKIPYTEYDKIGVPAIPGKTEATGVFALIEQLEAKAAPGYSVENDELFENFLAFAELYSPAATAAQVVETKTVYIVSTGADDILSSENDPDASFSSSQPYRVYTRVIELGKGQLDALRVLDCIPSSSPFSLGPATYESLNALVYEVGLNYEGVVVEYDRVPTDSVASYSAVRNGRIRIGYYASEVFSIAGNARVYMIDTETVGSGWGAATLVTGVREGSFAALTEDWNDSIRVVFNSAGEIQEAYIFVTEGVGSAPANIDEIQKFDFVYGVEPDDPRYGYDGVENPYAVDYALYNPLKDADNTTAADEDALYPLFVFFHGIGGGNNKNGLPTNDAGIGLRYIQSDYQAQFETDTEGVHGAYVMLPRANETSSHDLSTQGWLHGYRAGTNPRYAMGDESYKGKPTQVAAVIADIRYLIDHENIDPDRIYITGFSAGGYMTWQTLVEGGELFAAASPQGAAFFPEGSQLSTDYSEFELGFADKLLAVKDVPIWMIHARNDGTCAWDICPGDPVKDPANTFNGQNTLWGMVRSLSDGVSEIQGSPLTRVTIHNYLKTGAGADAGQHSPMLMLNNNRYETGLTTADGTPVTIFDTLYGVKPADYNEANPTAEDKASTWAYGKNPDYSTAADWTGTFIGWLNACGDAKANGPETASFYAAKQSALAAIRAAALPTAKELAGKTICIPGQEITSFPSPTDNKVVPTIERNPNMLPYTNWPSVGVPAIKSKYGNTAATGIFAKINAMLTLAPAGYSIDDDADFADFLGFAELYTPVAIEGTPVTATTAYVVAVSGDGAPLAQADDPDTDFAASYPAGASAYRVYTKVIEVGSGLMNLRLLDSFPLPANYTRGIITPEHLDAYVYEFGINCNGIAVEFTRVPTDAVQAYSANGNGTIRISYYDDEVYEIAEGAKIYDVVLPGRDSTAVTITDAGNLADLTGTDWGKSIRAVYDEDGRIIEAYRSGISDLNEPTSANYLAATKFDYYDGIRYDDPEFGYDGVENPYAVDFALYDPITDESNTSASDPNAKYPLFIFLHGFGGDANKNNMANVNGIGASYTTPDIQSQFKTGTEGVSGAYIMFPRSNRLASHDLNAQGWLHGYRGDTNPRYKLGDEAYKGKATQTSALISDILWLIKHKNIDPDRIYIGGQSAGGYMTWATLFEAARAGHADLFAAAIPNSAVFAPEGRNSEITGDYPETELGLREKLLAIKDIPIWLRHGMGDTTCPWAYTMGEVFSKEEYGINGKLTMYEIIASFADGISEIQGSPLTRVSIANGLGHSAVYMASNNKYTTVPDVLAELGYTEAYYTTIYGEQPADYEEGTIDVERYKPTMRDPIAYDYGASSIYSSGSYEDTIIGWLNACGDARSAK